MTLFKQLESADSASATPLSELIQALPWNEQGLLPAIAQCHKSGQVLMMAWMNQVALEETLQVGRVCYFSRSRQSLWRKGETSGHTQKLIELRFDCDGDAILCRVDQTGPACHTERPSCFYLKVTDNHVIIDG
ncbi:phosphoribosyl-AMP cyclohydrolase [bacterium]|nr:phosphoribosyl-AMP cyclohydrolase [bacterium]